MTSPVQTFHVKYMPAEITIFIRDVPWWYLRTYFRTHISLFRHYQNLFLERYGKEFTGTVVELGCEKHYQHQRYFPKVTSYECTNIGRDHDSYLNATAMDLPDESQDGFICISVLEHIQDFQAALAEIHRTLKPGGQLLLSVPFMYPRHDEIDFWRFSENFYSDFFPDYEIRGFVHFGGRLSLLADMLQKPYGIIGKRLIIYKLFGLLFALFARYVDIQDDYPIGYGIYAVKKG